MRARGALARYVGKRVLAIPVSMFIIATLAFGLVSLIPGDPAATIAGGFASPEKLAEIRAQLGLNKPFGTRYVDYLDDLVHGRLGHSFFTNESVGTSILRYLPSTLVLIVLSLIVALVLGLVLGGVGAYCRRRLPDRLTSVVTTAFQSIPDFVLALVLIFVVFYLLHLAPGPIGQVGLTAEQPQVVTRAAVIDSLLAGNMPAFASALHHLMLPVLTLGVIYSTYFAKVARSSLGAALRSPQIEFARACGLPERKVFGYALTMSRSSLLTYGLILFSTLIGGDAIVETVFSWHGVGQWALNGMLQVDVPVIQGFIVVSGLITIVVYVLLDVLLMALDPRVSHGRS